MKETSLVCQFGDHGGELGEVEDESLLPPEGAEVGLGQRQRVEEERVQGVRQLQGQLLGKMIHYAYLINTNIFVHLTSRYVILYLI